MKVASFDLVEFKAMDGDQGLFAARVAAFGNVDRGGDRIIKGAFKKSIERWQKSTKKVPVIFSHDWKVIEHFIGTVDPKSMMETEEGLVVAGRLDIEDNPKAKAVFRKLKDGSLSGWSFGYEVKQEREASDGARDLLEVDLLELGPTLVGMNPEVLTLAVKEAVFEDDLEIEEKAIDNSEWNGNRAMTSCSTAADYKSICAGERTVGQPDERQHWALPHHYLGKGANAAGVQAALGRVSQTQNLKSATSARSHLEAHQSAISGKDDDSFVVTDHTNTTSNAAITETITTVTQWSPEIEQKVGRALSAKREAQLRAIHKQLADFLQEFGSDLDDVEEASSTPETTEPVFGEKELLQRDIDDATVFVAERSA